MLNWRIIVGLALLFFCIKELYTIMGNSVKASPVYAEVGCFIWMGAGTFLVIRGMTKKPD